MTGDLVLVGCYTAVHGGHGDGISVFRRSAGALEPVGGLTMPSPSWLLAHPMLPIVYAANELDAGTVSVVAVDEDGGLALLDTAATGGSAPCHLALTGDRRHLLAANYTGGSVAVFALDIDGRIRRRSDLVQLRGSGPVADRQEGAHAHMVRADGDLVTVVDLGSDELRSYRVTDDGTLTSLTVTAVPPGTGPRQLVPAGEKHLLLGELSGRLLSLRGSATDGFVVLDAVPASARPGRNLPAQLSVCQDGRFGYVSNRGPDTIAVFALDGERPELVQEIDVGPGWPRHFSLAADTVLVGVQTGDRLLVLDRAPDTGLLTLVGETEEPSPACVLTLPAVAEVLRG